MAGKRIANKDLEGLEAITRIAQRYPKAPIKTRGNEVTAKMRGQFLPLILPGLKDARRAESLLGATGDDSLARKPEKVNPGEIIRLVDGPRALFANAGPHSHLFQVFLKLQNAISHIRFYAPPAAPCCRSHNWPSCFLMIAIRSNRAPIRFHEQFSGSSEEQLL
jgi:DNA-binding IscR family transcriptional regulator